MENSDFNPVTIEVGNVTSKILGATGQMISTLYTGMSCLVAGYYFTPAYKNGRWDGKVHFFERKTRTFPTGLLSQVLELLEPFEVKVEIHDKRKNRSARFPIEPLTEIELPGGKQLRDYQVDAVNKATGHFENGMLFQRGIINIATNGGKTVIAEALIQQLYPKLEGDRVFLFVTHSKEIAHQAIKSFENDLGIKVGLVGDGKANIEKVTVAMVSTLYSRMNKHHPLFADLVRRCVGFIGDEIHHSTSNSWYEVLSCFEGATIRIGLTGTVQKDQDKRMKLYSACGQVLVKITNDYLIKHDYSAKPKCFLVPVDYPDIDRHMRYKGQEGKEGMLLYPDVYYKGIVANSYRNYLIAKVCNKEVTEQKGQVLVLVEHVEHGVNIQRMMEIVNPDVKCIFLHGELSSTERQTGLELLKAGDVDVVVSTAILDEGVDVLNINALVYARGGKSTRKVLQGVGRGLRKKADGSALHVYDFLDDTSEPLIKHSLGRYKTLKHEKFEITKVDLENDLGFTTDEKVNFMANYDDAFDDDSFQYVGGV